MQDKHPVRIKHIGPDIYTFVPEEDVVLKVDKILGKLSNEAAPGLAGLRNTHIKMWMGAFAPASADTAIQHLEDFITDMANDKLPPWFMQAMQGADLLAIIKAEARGRLKADHRPVVMPNTFSKITKKAMMEDCKEDYARDLLPQQLGVGVKFAAELLAMGIRMTLHVKPYIILMSIDLRNAYNAIWREAVVERHRGHMTLKRTVPYWRAKLRPRSPIWADDITLWGDDGLHQGSPSSGSAFALTIQPWVREADKKLTAAGGCARLGMDDG